MASQNNAAQQFDRTHAITMVATAALAANRLAAYDGGYATSAGGIKDAQGVTQSSAAIDAAVAVTTRYSDLVEASAVIAFGDWIKPAADGTGRAAVGTRTDNCGRALSGASAVGVLFEMQIHKHIQP